MSPFRLRTLPTQIAALSDRSGTEARFAALTEGHVTLKLPAGATSGAGR